MLNMHSIRRSAQLKQWRRQYYGLMKLRTALGMDEGQSGANTHVFSTFLTWLQEKPPMVFVAATANRIHALPAEVIRKGRFDQVFFIDLPNDEERKQIFEIHLQRHGADLSKFDLVFLCCRDERLEWC